MSLLIFVVASLVVGTATAGNGVNPGTDAGGGFVSRIRLLDGERWYGGAVNLGGDQPWTAESVTQDRRAGAPDYDLANRSWGGAVMPLLVSDKGRYVWGNGPFRFRFEKGVLRIASNVETVRVAVAGTTLKEACRTASARHFPFCGVRPPSEFFVKPQFNNWIEIFLHGVSQEVSERYVKDLAASGFPCGVFMTDGGWMTHHGSERFDELKFPDPVRYFDLIRANGWKSILWMSPFVSPDSQVEYRRLRHYPHAGIPGSGYERGLDYLVHERKGNRCAILRWWSGNSAAYDLTDPAAFEYYVKRLEKFAADYHFDGFKFDAGDAEHLPDDHRLHEPWMPRCEYCRAFSRVGTRIAYNEFRVAYGTGGQPIVQRLNDQPHEWQAQGRIIRDVIVAGLIGYPYVVGDMIGGGLCGSFFPGRPFSPKLMVRSCQLQALMPMMQFSLAPWRVLDARHCGVCRDFAKLHCAFAPYILKWADHAAKTGEPILRSMEYEFPGQGFGDCLAQFMLGPDWLVVPVIGEDDRVVVRLPKGTWDDDLGERHVGPKTLELEHVPLERLPRYRRMPPPMPDRKIIKAQAGSSAQAGSAVGDGVLAVPRDERFPPNPSAHLPVRKPLSHIVPWCVKATDAIYFITVNARQRGTNEILDHAVSILSAARYYQKQGTWFLYLLLLMPDHLHMLVQVPPALRLGSVIGKWKSYLTQTCHVAFQSDFFDTRIRDGEHFEEKWNYVCRNPVVRGLVDSPREWRYSIAFNPTTGEELSRKTDGGTAGTPSPTAEPVVSAGMTPNLRGTAGTPSPTAEPASVVEHS